MAAEEVSGNIAERLKMQLAMIPIIDLRHAKSFMQGMQRMLEKQLSIAAMDKRGADTGLSEPVMKKLFIGLADAGVVNLKPVTPEAFDTTADSERMQRDLASGKLKPLFGIGGPA